MQPTAATAAAAALAQNELAQSEGEEGARERERRWEREMGK